MERNEMKMRVDVEEILRIVRYALESRGVTIETINMIHEGQAPYIEVQKAHTFAYYLDDERFETVNNSVNGYYVKMRSNLWNLTSWEPQYLLFTIDENGHLGELVDNDDWFLLNDGPVRFCHVPPSHY